MDGEESKYKPETVSKESSIVKDFSKNLQKIHKSEIFMKLKVISQGLICLHKKVRNRSRNFGKVALRPPSDINK